MDLVRVGHRSVSMLLQAIEYLPYAHLTYLNERAGSTCSCHQKGHGTHTGADKHPPHLTTWPRH